MAHVLTAIRLLGPRVSRYVQFLVVPAAVLVGYTGTQWEGYVMQDKQQRDQQRMPTAYERREERFLKELAALEQRAPAAAVAAAAAQDTAAAAAE